LKIRSAEVIKISLLINGIYNLSKALWVFCLSFPLDMMNCNLILNMTNVKIHVCKTKDSTILFKDICTQISSDNIYRHLLWKSVYGIWGKQILFYLNGTKT